MLWLQGLRRHDVERTIVVMSERTFPYQWTGRAAAATVLTVTLAEMAPHAGDHAAAPAAWGLSPAMPVHHEHTPERHYQELGRIQPAYVVTSSLTR